MVAYIEYARNNSCQVSQRALIQVVNNLAGIGEAVTLILQEAFHSGWSYLTDVAREGKPDVGFNCSPLDGEEEWIGCYL